MNPYLIQRLASVQIADRLQQAEQSRLRHQVRAARTPRRLVAGRRRQWLSLWFVSPRGPRMA